MEEMKAWLIEHGLLQREMYVLIGTEAEALSKAETMKGETKWEEPWVSGPYDFTIAIKP